MILRKTSKRLASLYDDAKAKDGAKISADHVQQILAKIDRKERKVQAALEEPKETQLGNRHRRGIPAMRYEYRIPAREAAFDR